MRALVSEGPERLALREVETPEPGPGDILVRVGVALTCATDFKLARRGHPKFPFPLTLGHEFAGLVEKAGDGALFKAGERVTSAVSSPCGLCAECRAGRENLCETAFEEPLFGAFADFLLVPERIVRNGLRRIPDGLSDEAAALLDPLASVVHALARVRIADGDDVLIVGTGPIAAMLFFLLRGKGRESEREKTRGAERRIVVAGRRPEKLAFFERNKAEVARIGSSPRDPRAAASPPIFTFEENSVAPPRIARREERDRTAASSPFAADLSSSSSSSFSSFPSFPLIIDTTGDPGVIEALPALAANGGTVLLFAGMAEGARVSLDAFALHYREVSITGSFHYTPDDADAALALLLAGAIPVSSLVQARRNLSEWREAFDLAVSGGAMKVAIVP